MKLLEGVRADAVLSDDLKYRYVLTRDWDASALRIVFIMLNPSTADADIDDQTLRKCQGFARMWRFGALTVVNLFALRATDPAELAKAYDPVGPENDAWLRRIIREAGGPLVAAWGHKAGFLGRDRIVTDMVHSEGRKLYRIGPPTPLRAMPRHPSRLSYELTLQAHP